MEIPEDDQPARRNHPQRIHATNLPVVDEDSASAEVQQLYGSFRQDFGRPQVPGILQCFATHPPLLLHMIGLAKSMLFVDGALNRRQKEMISTFVSAKNRCSYCADSHAYSFRLNGGSAQALDAVLSCNPDDPTLQPDERTLLRFVGKITEASHDIHPEDIEDMRSAGWNDLQIAEAIHVAALFASFNRVVNAFGLPSQQMLALFEQPQHRKEVAARA